MNIAGKEYQLVVMEKLSTRGGKLIILMSETFNKYIACPFEEEEKLYGELKDIWKRLVPEIVTNADEHIMDYTKVSAKETGEVLNAFFSSSEAKE